MIKKKNCPDNLNCYTTDNDSNEPKVYYSTHTSTKVDLPKKVNEGITESQFEECDENT